MKTYSSCSLPSSYSNLVNCETRNRLSLFLSLLRDYNHNCTCTKGASHHSEYWSWQSSASSTQIQSRHLHDQIEKRINKGALFLIKQVLTSKFHLKASYFGRKNNWRSQRKRKAQKIFIKSSGFILFIDYFCEKL